MSLQLVLYPQVYNGQYTYNSVVSTSNLIADSIFWYANFFLITSPVTTSTPSETAMLASVPVQAWKTYHTNGGSFDATAAPTITTNTNKINLTSTGTGKSGAYQLVDGLSIGTEYNITVKITTGAVGTFSIKNFGGSSITIGGTSYNVIGGNGYTLSNSLTGTAATNLTYTFIATQESMIFCMNWESPGNTVILINQVILKQNPSTPIITDVDDGQVILDMYSHESLPLTLSIDNFKNIAEKTQSYSKSFSLPATKHNNKIFNHLYDVTIATQGQSNVFNPYKISKALLKEDGHVIFEGSLTLINITDIDGNISYNVNLFSASVALKTVIGNKTFADFDNGFDELYHEYNKTSIKDSWIGSLPVSALPVNSHAGSSGATTTNVLKYPFCRYNGDITQFTTGANEGFPRIWKLSDAFRPWVRVKYLFDRIISEAGFQYQSDFIEGIGNYAGSGTSHEPDFKRLFMDFNWGNDANPASDSGAETTEYIRDLEVANNAAGTSDTRIIFNSNEDNLVSQGWVSADDEFVAVNDNTDIDISFNINIQNFGATNYRVRLQKETAAGTIIVIKNWWEYASGSQTKMYSDTKSVTLDAGDKLYFTFRKSNGSAIQGISGTPAVPTCDFTSSVMSNYIDTSVLLTKRSKIKQWDFIKDIFTMFNLVVLKSKDDDTVLKIEPYGDIFINSNATTNITQNLYDWTDKVDLSEVKLTSLKLKQQVEFNYKKDEKDYATGVYEDSTGYVFGNYEIDASSFAVASGVQKLDLKVFGSTFCTPLFSDFSSTLTVPQMVTQKSDGTIEGFDNKPRILYDVSDDQSTHTDLPQLSYGTYRIPAAAGLGDEDQGYVCLFSHVTDLPTVVGSRDFNFGAHQIISSMGNTPTLNLFTEYWSPYYDELYHSDTRTMSVKVLLTPLEISKINFYDFILIKNRQYRINKIDYKPNQLSNVELILLS